MEPQLLKSAEEVKRWQAAQRELVLLVSCYVASVREYLEKCDASPSYADDLNALRRFHSTAQTWDGPRIYEALKVLNHVPFIAQLTNRQSLMV